MVIVGIVLALLSAVLLSVSTQFQHHGVNTVASQHDGFAVKQFLLLFRQPRWVVGMLISAVAATIHLVSLGLAPVIVVQPVGVVALVLTAVFNRRLHKTRFTRRAVLGIVSAVVGIGVFVATAALIAREPEITDARLLVVLTVLTVVLLLTGVLLFIVRRHPAPFVLILAGGALHGFDAILLKSIIFRVTHGMYGGLTLLCLLGLVLAFSLGTFYVQHAYAVTSPDVVLGGQTVIDPMVAVIVGATILGEAAHASLGFLAVFVVTGALACAGVVLLTGDANRSKLLANMPNGA